MDDILNIIDSSQSVNNFVNDFVDTCMEEFISDNIVIGTDEYNNLHTQAMDMVYESLNDLTYGIQELIENKDDTDSDYVADDEESSYESEN